MLELLAVTGAGLAATAYLVATRVSRHRGWPRRRTALWLLGLLTALVATVGPLAEAAHHSFPAHVTAHLLVAMVAPLLLVSAAPVTLALRALPVSAARRLAHVLHTRLLRVLTEPAVAGLLEVGGLWLFYRTGLLAASRQDEGLHLVTHLHMFLAGTVFTVAVVGIDPMPHRRSFAHRSVVLVLASAAHSVLAKTLYAAPPIDVTREAAQTGAMIMYYGGDVVEVALLVVLCTGWYRSRKRLSYPARIPSASGSPGLPRGRSRP